VSRRTALLAFADGDLRAALRGVTTAPQADAEALVRRVHPDHEVVATGSRDLWESVYPPDEVTFAISLPGADLLCDGRLAFDRPSELPKRLVELAAGRRIIMHAMHSVVDWFAFAIWEKGEIVRSLSLSPDSGIIENIGAPLSFERSYWAGEFPVEPVSGWPDQKAYPLPFHPLDLGEEALRALFGFVLEGRMSPDDIDAEAVQVHGFRVVDPAGA
jgi:hypothetical protein